MSSDEFTTPTFVPLLTRDLPGVGGAIKQFDEDFRVEELPLYAASGEGTHTYLVIEKQGITTLEATRLLARALGKQPRDIGYAGLKDAHGITRQTFSVEHVTDAQIEELSSAKLRVLSIDRHTNKIKLGHLAGNRFEIKIRGAETDALARVTAVLAVLETRGVPNFFGPQRFGARGDNAAIGLAVIKDRFDEAVALILGRPGPADHGAVRRARELFDAGNWDASARAWPPGFREQIHVCREFAGSNGDARKAWRAVHHTLRKLYVSALQSELFNRVLTKRIDSVDQLSDGDVAWKHRNGACFLVEDASIEQPRCDGMEISPTGPIFGPRMTSAQALPGEIEQNVLGSAELKADEIRARDGGKLRGARRPLRVPISHPSASAGNDDHGPFIHLSFSLPPGAYATTVTREICKPES